MLRGLSRLLRLNLGSIELNITSSNRGASVGTNLGLARPRPTLQRRLNGGNIFGLGPLCSTRSIATVTALKPVFFYINLGGESQCKRAVFPTLIQNRCYTSRMKAKKKKPVRDLEPVVHSLNRYYDLDPSQPKLYFDEVQELKTADENIKKIFSLEFASSAEIKQYKSHKLMQELKEKIGLEPHATKTELPLRIARLTMAVRNCGKHVIKNPKDKSNKRKMLINIDRRRKYLKRLRGRNYSHFESIQNELGIKWVPIPKYNWQNTTRRQIERRTIKNKARWERFAAQKEFEQKRWQENMVEIVRLKKDLGKDLTEEEKQFDTYTNA